jgi:hypothetical protein
MCDIDCKLLCYNDIVIGLCPVPERRSGVGRIGSAGIGVQADDPVQSVLARHGISQFGEHLGGQAVAGILVPPVGLTRCGAGAFEVGARLWSEVPAAGERR